MSETARFSLQIIPEKNPYKMLFVIFQRSLLIIKILQIRGKFNKNKLSILISFPIFQFVKTTNFDQTKHDQTL